MEKLNESVLDPIQKYRCDAMFNQNDTTDDPVLLFTTKQFIFSILDKFKEDCKSKKFEYTQAFIVGSSLGYQYRDDCDIDIDVKITLTRNEMKGKFHCIPKNIMLPNTAHPVNIFVMTADDEDYNFDNAENAYDLLTDTWIKHGKLQNSDAIPFEYVSGVSEFIMDGMVLELSRAERDLYDIDKYINMDPNKVTITESEKKAAISQKISELIIDKDALKLAHTFMFRLNVDGFEDKPINVSIKYKYEDKHYSMNNLIYKYIDKYGYYEKIVNMVKRIDEVIGVAKEALTAVEENSPETKNNMEAQNELLARVAKTEIPVIAKTENVEPIKQAEEPVNDQEEVKEPTEEAPAEDKKEQEANDEVIPEGNKLTEGYNDLELLQILKENGYDPSLLNVIKLRTHNYALVDSFNDCADIFASKALSEAINPEKLKNKTEKKLNKMIFKASGKVSDLIASGLGYLFGGPVGMIIGSELSNTHNNDIDDFSRELYSEIEYDDECQRIISDIKNEVNSESPDRNKLTQLKRDFAKAIKECKKRITKNNTTDKYAASKVEHNIDLH